MKIHLVSYTKDAAGEIIRAAQTCRKSSREMGNAQQALFLYDLQTRGHMSPFEFADYTFRIEGISRVASHQLVRHRHLSFQHESQRAVKANRFQYPPSMKDNAPLKAIMQTVYDAYDKLIESGVEREDARYILPLATTSNMMMKGNARALIEFLELRCCKQTQEELRDGANQIALTLKNLHPTVFFNVGAKCGVCPNRGTCK